MKENYREIMQESGLPLSESEIKTRFQTLAEQENLITNTSKYSPFWRLVTAVAVNPVMWLIHALTDYVMPNLFVKTASEKFLQIMGWSIGLSFKEASKTRGTITFFKDSPTYAVTVKKGTVIQTADINGTVYRLFVDNDTVIPAGTDRAGVAVTAEYAGKAYNLGGGYYSILPEAVSGIARVTNGDDWMTEPGADRETADEFRQRYRTAFSSVGQHHIDSVYRGMIAEIAGLSVDRIYFLHDAPRGPGTANAYILLDSGTASAPFVDKINGYITAQGYHGHGDDLICYAMPETKHHLSCTVYFHADLGLSDARKAEIVKIVELMIRSAWRENSDYAVSKTYPYSRFSWSKLGEEIHAARFEIQSVEWGQGDIVTQLNIPRIQSLTVKRGN